VRYVQNNTHIQRQDQFPSLVITKIPSLVITRIIILEGINLGSSRFNSTLTICTTDRSTISQKAEMNFKLTSGLILMPTVQSV